MTTVAATIAALRPVADGQGLLTAAEASAVRDAIEHLEQLLPLTPLSAEEIAGQTWPIPLRCGDCGHRWDGPWLPMPATHMPRLTHRLACCGRCGSSRVYMGGTEA